MAKLLLQEFAERLFEDKNITLEITDELIEKIALAGFDLNFGARPIKRAIEEIVENKSSRIYNHRQHRRNGKDLKFGG